MKELIEVMNVMLEKLIEVIKRKNLEISVLKWELEEKEKELEALKEKNHE